MSGLTDAMKEKELIALVKTLVIYRQKHGKAKFLDLLEQFNAILDLEKEVLANGGQTSTNDT
jgi:hypothetical protein